eukprot:CAMPEP_0169197958 /NCGR_PEP_ID=MMETSP1016-20121227/8558_1 /TAXON_ID=342587 /ORGANISM="Karlodinium micrum, Strain CCMP2283" /LENGTH=114 /DNA_ID=CAMNT_0009274665 /DNA_START=1 /DNA_END=345 /DNA_ORIENTATION=+
MTKPIRRILEQVKLLPFFSHIYGSEGFSMGCTAYDRSVAGINKEQTFQINVPKSKSEKLGRLIKERMLDFGQVAFIDDEFSEIEAARRMCKTIFISCGMGMQEQDVERLRTMVE